jgi:hypothetical protein
MNLTSYFEAEILNINTLKTSSYSNSLGNLIRLGKPVTAAGDNGEKSDVVETSGCLRRA